MPFTDYAEGHAEEVWKVGDISLLQFDHRGNNTSSSSRSRNSIRVVGGQGVDGAATSAPHSKKQESCASR